MGVFQIFPNFYEDEKSRSILPGRLVWVPATQVEVAPRILEVERSSPREHDSMNFKIVELNDSHFKDRVKLPIAKFKLTSTEEAIVSKAKKRLCVVMARVGPIDTSLIEDNQQQKVAEHLSKTTTYIVAPLFSVSSKKEPGTFAPIMVSRIRAMQYLQFFCLPDKDPPEVPRSIIRLDRIFPTHLARACEATDKKIHEEPFEVIKEQLYLLFDKNYPQRIYSDVKELATGSLP